MCTPAHQLAVQANKKVGKQVIHVSYGTHKVQRILPEENECLLKRYWLFLHVCNESHSIVLTNILLSTLSPLVSSFTFFLTEIFIFLPITSLTLSEIKENTLIKYLQCQHEKETDTTVKFSGRLRAVLFNRLHSRKSHAHAPVLNTT